MLYAIFFNKPNFFLIEFSPDPLFFFPPYCGYKGTYDKLMKLQREGA